MTTNDFDPTKNRVPFGLLSEDEQEALKAWPHEWEVYKGCEWVSITSSNWSESVVYRGKPAPVVVTTWTPIYENGCTGFAYDSLNEARVGVIGVRMVGFMRLDITDGIPKATIIGGNNQ